MMGCVVGCRSEGRSSFCIKGWEGCGVMVILLFLMIASAEAANKSAVHPTAIIHTTAGDLKCELFSDKAPKTVANFIGLSNGTKAWTNPTTGKQEIRHP